MFQPIVKYMQIALMVKSILIFITWLYIDRTYRVETVTGDINPILKVGFF